MPPIRIVAAGGRVRVDVGPELQAWVDRVVRQAMPRTLAVMEEGVEGIRAAASAAWPVKTGVSKAALTSSVEAEGLTAVRAAVRNDAKHPKLRQGEPVYYARYIKDPVKGYVMTELLQKPTRKLAKRVAETLAEELPRGRR